MNYNEIVLKTKDGGEKIYKFRLTCENCCAIEEKNKMSIIQFVGNESMQMIATMLMYMNRWETPQFSMKDAQQLYDLFIENGWTYKKIIQDVIYETLVCSGFLEKAEWEEIKEQTKEATKRLKTKQTEAIKSI